MIVTVTANPLLDHLAAVDLAVGQAQRVEAFRATAGGKGLNVARVLARHGHTVVACGFLGGRSGDEVADLVLADGVEPDFTRIDQPTRRGFQAIGRGGAVTTLMERGPAVGPDEQEALVRQVVRRARDAALVIVGGAPPAGCAMLYRQLAEALAATRVPCWIDAYGPAMAEVLAGPVPPALAKPNREEYGEDHRPWLAVRELHLTAGPGQIRVRHPQGLFSVHPPPVREVNATGSGDCYLAGLAHARLSGYGLEAQLRYAAAAGAANAARDDVASIGPEEIEALQAAVEVVPGR
jgi:fructose-1-phosphate kinase PfkB-like protein